ncbi:MAG: glycosyltransferase family 39 protein [Chloroflexi bacterium]|nr:glycosyltransferase family 39 protein [Chloroflexota bacterium]
MAGFRLNTAQYRKPVLAVLLLVYLVLCVAYNFNLPLFEAPDEGAHYIYVDYIARNHALPDLNNQPSHEVSQPPLYYALGAPLIAWINRDDFHELYRPDPSLQNGIVYDHLPRERDFPPTGVTLAMRILRLYSTLLGAVTVLLVYAAVRNLFGRYEVALLAVSLTAFNPKFIHMSSQFNNDIAVICAGALCVWMASRMMMRNSLPSFKATAALGAAVGVATVAKYSGMAMGLVAAYTVAWCVWSACGISDIRSSLVHFVKLGAVCLAGFAVTAGLLFLYNGARYGSPLATAQFEHSNAGGVRAIPLSLMDIIARMPWIIHSYWGDFGHGVQFPAVVDRIMFFVAAVAFIGVFVALALRQMPKSASLLLVTFIVTFAAYLIWLRNQDATENARLLGPAFTVISISCAVGLLAWIPTRYEMSAAFSLTFLSAAGAVIALNLALINGYPTPGYLSDGAASMLPEQGAARFDNGIELVSASVSANRVAYGQDVSVSVYWRATRPVTDVYRAIVDLRNPDEISLGSVSGLPLNGRYATTQLEPGRTFMDTYHVKATPAHPGETPQTLVRILVGWFRQLPPYEVSRVQGSGAANAQIDVIKIEGARPPDITPAHSFSSTVADLISLEGYQIADRQLTLYWRSMAQSPRNYTVFVHVLDTAGNLTAQADAPFAYPLNLWDPGEQVQDVHIVDGLATAARIEVGVYDAATGQRLTAARPDKAGWPDNAVVIPLR